MGIRGLWKESERGMWECLEIKGYGVVVTMMMDQDQPHHHHW